MVALSSRPAVMRNPLTVAVAYLDRPSALGALRRIDGLEATLQAAGMNTLRLPVPLLPLSAAMTNKPLRKLSHVATGRSASPVLLWDEDQLQQRLDAGGADVVLLSTTRMWSERIARARPIVLDYVDMLSTSYRHRSAHSSGAKRALYRGLAEIARHEEGQVQRAGVVTMAAGYLDSQLLQATWIPITFDLDPLGPRTPDYDLIFFGSLHYPPNVAAIQALYDMWPEILRRRPDVSAIIAGSNATPDVLRMINERRWHHIGDFADVRDVVSQARIAVTPLPVASGIQNKVLEAAALGLPQVISEAAAAGMAPGFPAVIGKLPDFPLLIADLLDNDTQMDKLKTEGPLEMKRQYSSSALAPHLSRLVEQALRR